MASRHTLPLALPVQRPRSTPSIEERESARMTGACALDCRRLPRSSADWPYGKYRADPLRLTAADDRTTIMTTVTQQEGNP
jgi:hypothetical protein